MKKHFINAQQLLTDSYLLADKVLQDDFKPTYIIGVWRGGAPIGIAVQEYFDYKNISVDHISVRTSSYLGINKESKEITVDGLQYIVEKANAEDSILIVDDVFDTGKSISALLSALQKQLKDEMPNDIRIAVPWFKPNNNQTDITPQYYLHTSADWLVFPHEIQGLSTKEINEHKSDLLPILELFDSGG